jgi:hypothetical protein
VSPDSAAPAPQAGTEAAAPADRVDLSDAAAVVRWCEHFGITREQLEEAVKAAGDDPSAVREHLLNQGASAGAG